MSELQSLLKPIMLRRLKEDVAAGEIPAKVPHSPRLIPAIRFMISSRAVALAQEETIIWVELTARQRKLYRGVLDKNFSLLAAEATASSGKKAAPPSMNNIFMQLRKLCNHPQLLAREDAPMPERAGTKAAKEAAAALVSASGKMVLLDKLLPRLRAEKRKVLIFSQARAE